MEEKQAISNKPAPINIQVHEIQPTSEGMSFGDLLEKFYLNSEMKKADDALKAGTNGVAGKAFGDVKK